MKPIWIRLSDKLPNWSERVLGVDKHGNMHVFSIELTMGGYETEIEHYGTARYRRHFSDKSPDVGDLIFWTSLPPEPNVK